MAGWRATDSTRSTHSKKGAFVPILRAVQGKARDLTTGRSTSNKTKAITPHKYSIPNNSLLVERLERRVGKQLRNRS